MQALYPLGLAGHWQSQVPSHLSASLKNWLLDAGSLTARLQHQCAHFHVQLLGQQVVTCSPEEANQVINAGSEVLAREVLLNCDGVAQVFARSLLPLSSLTGEQQQLAQLGEQPLGQVIFNQTDMQRSAIEVAEFKPVEHSKLNQLLTELNQNTQQALWGRRSTFYVAHKPLLVAEMFLPAAQAYQMPKL